MKEKQKVLCAVLTMPRHFLDLAGAGAVVAAAAAAAAIMALSPRIR